MSKTDRWFKPSYKESKAIERGEAKWKLRGRQTVKLSVCKKCQKQIKWHKTKEGRWLPLNPDNNELHFKYCN